MRSEDAVEIVRASLALAFPTASAEGLTRAAESVLRWGSEDVAEHLNGPLTTRMLEDLLDIADVPHADYQPADEEWIERASEPAQYRIWSRTDVLAPLPFYPRPLDDPTTSSRYPDRGEERGDGPDGFGTTTPRG
ncbi:hypothetical protein ACFYU9_12565 [Streptomyces sp. NPDC004327]|uniref:hypothetical protein n=1 Tax=unclassified Streptomyces TaxID=2593676 RepID=UPI0036AF05BD